MYGVGYYDTLGFPQYQNYFKVNADVLGPTNDKFRRYDGTNWGTVQYESSFFASGPTGVQFHSKDSSDESKFLAIAPSYYDGIPKVWVLRNNPGEDDPTFNDIDKTNQEPDIWVSGTTSVVNQDIVYWYKSYRTVTSTTCQPTAPCSVGPIV
ncbi:MAG: hypothetical protein ACREA4_12750 [Nitrososphaera sp.]